MKKRITLSKAYTAGVIDGFTRGKASALADVEALLPELLYNVSISYDNWMLFIKQFKALKSLDSPQDVKIEDAHIRSSRDELSMPQHNPVDNTQGSNKRHCSLCEYDKDEVLRNGFKGCGKQCLRGAYNYVCGNKTRKGNIELCPSCSKEKQE